jgi:hypothetical protein
MVSMALELAHEETPYADLALKFFEHFVAIAKASNELGGTGLWDDVDGFYYDQMRTPGHGPRMLKIRSMVGLVPLFAAASLDDELLQQLPVFHDRLTWFFANRPELARSISVTLDEDRQHRLLAIPNRERLERVLCTMLDEREFLSPYGIRSLSRVHADAPYHLRVDHSDYEVRYAPGESDTSVFGGNSNWRGPVWFPVNYLIIESLTTTATSSPSSARPAAAAACTWARSPRSSSAGWSRCSCPTSAAAARATARLRVTPTTRRSRTSCCSTSTFTATPGADWARATRPGGPRSPPT